MKTDEELEKFIRQFEEFQEPLGEELVRIIYDNFWDLCAASDDQNEEST